MLTPCYTYVTLIMKKINIDENILSIRIFFLYDLKEHHVLSTGFKFQAIRVDHYEIMTFLSMLTNSVALFPPV